MTSTDRILGRLELFTGATAVAGGLLLAIAPDGHLLGLGLVAFEATELLWLGFQPLEAVFALVGATVAVLALIPAQDVDAA